MEPDEHLLSFVFFDYDKIRTHGLDTSLTQSQLDLIDDFTAAVEKLGDEQGFFDEADWENLGLGDWMDEEGEST